MVSLLRVALVVLSAQQAENRRAPSAQELDAALRTYYGALHGLIGKAESMTLLRIDGNDWKPVGRGRIGGYRVLADQKALADSVVDKLRQLLLNSANFPTLTRVGWGKGCGGFRPGAVLKIEGTNSDGKRMSGYLLFCFECGDMGVIRSVTRKQLLSRWEWTPPNMDLEDMSPIESTLLHAFAAAMPDDRDFIGLVERERRLEELREQAEAAPSQR
jgi:hypothetical protein